MSNRSIGGCLVALWAIVLIENLSQQKTRIQCSDERVPRDEIEQPFGQSPIVVTLADRTADSEEQEHRQAEKEYWRKTSRYACLAVVVSGLAFCAAVAAFLETRRQADAADQSNRPWIAVQNFSIEGAQIKRGEIFFQASILLKNIGENPAKDVYINWKTGLPFGGESWVEEREFCNSDFGADSEQHAFILFPKTTGKRMLLLNVKKVDTDGYTKRVPLRVIGCVYYTGNDNVERRTGFLFRIDPDMNWDDPSTAKSVKALDDPSASAFID